MKFLLQYNENKVLSSHYREINKNDFDYMLKRFCKNFDWNDTPIYKGFDNLEQPYYVTNPQAINRESRNTANYYTVIFDNSPYRKDFPKRNKSLICSTARFTAENYGDVYRVIPFDGAKIAVCPDYDFWVSFNSYNDGIRDLDCFNRHLFNIMIIAGIDIDTNILIEQLNDLYTNHANIIRIYNVNNDINFPLTLDELYQSFNPKNNDINLYDYKTYAQISNFDRECWLDSKVLLVITEQ